MTRIYALICAAALALSACAHIKPVVTTVITCSGETVPAALVDEVFTDISTENWGDLALNAVPALKAGWDDVACIYDALKGSHPELKPHMEKLRAQHVELRVALRSPGDEKPRAGACTAVYDSRGHRDRRPKC